MSEEMIPIVLFIAIASAVVAYFYWNHKIRKSIMSTVQVAIERGTELTPELLTKLGAAGNPRLKDLRRGIVFLALGVAGMLCSLFFEDADVVNGIQAGSVFPLMLGVAFLLVWKLSPE